MISDFSAQADAMGALFAIAGGLISAQDEHAAEALRVASAPPPEVTGPNLGTASLGGVSGFSGEQLPGFFRVAGEDASGMSLESLQAAANALDPGAASSVADQFRNAATTLENAATTLRDSIDRELGTSWKGEFADAALANVGAFHQSAIAAAGDLAAVADKATGLSEGYEYTRSQIGTQVAVGASGDAATDSARDAALEDAKRVVHTEYNPRIEDANLAGMNFTTAHRIGSGFPAGGQQVSPIALWNPDPGAYSPTGGTGNAGARAASAAGSGTGLGSAGTGVDAATSLAAVNNSGAGATTTTGMGGSGAHGAPSGPASASATGVPGAVGAVGTAPGGRSSLMTTAAANPTTTRSSGATGSGGSGMRTATGSSSGGGYGQSSSGGASRGFGGASALSGNRGAGGIGGATAGAGRGGASVGALGGPGAGLVGGSAGAAGGAGSVGAAGAGGAAGGAGASGGCGAAGSAARGGMMGAMPMGAGAGRGEEKTHQMADYLIHPAHKEKLLGNGPQQVNGVLRGKR